MSKQNKNGKRRGKRNKNVLSLKTYTMNNMSWRSIIRGTENDDASGATGYCFFVNYPTYRRGSAGTIGQMGNVAGIFAEEKTVFDEFKVEQLVLSYAPFINGQLLPVGYTTASGNSGVTAIQPFASHVSCAVDHDDASSLTSLAEALNAQGVSVKNRLGYSVKHLITYTQTDPIEKLKWCNTQQGAPNVTTPPEPNNPSKLSSVKLYTWGGIASVNVGFFIAEWFVVFKGAFTLT